MSTTNPILLRIDPTPFTFVSFEYTMPSYDGPLGRRAFISCGSDIQMVDRRRVAIEIAEAGITLIKKKQLVKVHCADWVPTPAAGQDNRSIDPIRLASSGRA
jgi:hypothetical protein